MKIIYARDKHTIRNWASVLVDDEDYEKFSKYYWYLDKADYVRTHTANNLKSVYLHRLIMNVFEEGVEIDHRDRDKLNCQKDNLRICTRAGNSQNKDKMFTNTSGYKGVHYCKRECKFQARIYLGTYRKSLGYYFTAEEAARVYDKAAQKHFGEFAFLNFPELKT